MVADLSGLNVDDLFMQAQGDNPFGLDQALSENQEIETVVVDSVTAISFRALQKAVKDRVGAGRGFVPSIMAPGISAYGGRNGLTLDVLTGLLRVTSKHGVHVIFTAHEADPEKDEQGVVMLITIMLGGQIVNNVTWRLSEIWHLEQSLLGTKERRLSIRSTEKRKPMKTRMFSDMGEAKFVLAYDANKPDKGQMTIAGWHEAWIKGGFEKLKVPQQKEKAKWL